MKRQLPDARQIGFTFDAPVPAEAAGDLAGLDRKVALTVAAMLKGDPRSRYELAGAMSALLDETVTKPMLDAYASESRDTYNISIARFLALCSVTDSFAALDRIVRHVGVSLLVGEEIVLAKMADMELRIDQMNRELKTLRATAKPLGSVRT